MVYETYCMNISYKVRKQLSAKDLNYYFFILENFSLILDL